MAVILDKMLIGGIRFVLDKLISAVDAEMNDEDHLREELLAAQMRFELGEMTEDEFGEIETSVLAALREIQERKRGQTGPREAFGGAGAKITGIDVTFGGDEAETESNAVIGVESGSELRDPLPEEAQIVEEAYGIE